MSIHFLKKLDLEGQSSFFSASKIFSRRGLGQNFEPQGFLYRQFLEGEICYMGKFLVPGRPLDRASWGEAGSGPIMTAMQGAKKGSSVLQKCCFFFFEATKKSKTFEKLIFCIEIVSRGFTDGTLAWPGGTAKPIPCRFPDQVTRSTLGSWLWERVKPLRVTWAPCQSLPQPIPPRNT